MGNHTMELETGVPYGAEVGVGGGEYSHMRGTNVRLPNLTLLEHQ